MEMVVLDEETRITLAELCRICNVRGEVVLEMIEEGVITPQAGPPAQWCFTLEAVDRVLRAMRLQRDLRVNLPGCALVLDLLEEIEALRRELRCR